jgi:hypothetical protein
MDSERLTLSHTVQQLPDGYQEIFYLRVTEGRNLLWLNFLSLGLLILSLLLFFGWLLVYHTLGAPLVISHLPDHFPALIGLGIAILVFVLHEWIHGLAIQYYGHKPRYGIKPLKGVLFATADNAYFWRDQYLVVMLAPLVGISLLGILLSLVFPAGASLWLILAAAMNVAGATGDIWMAYHTLRFDHDHLFRDEEDGMRVFAPQPPM